MKGEEIIENGVVIKALQGKAEVALTEGDNCEECTAKIFCNPKADNTKVLEVIDDYGVAVGDKVIINVAGKSILGATILLYFVPLLVLLAAIILGLNLFEGIQYAEAFSFGLAVGAMALYYLAVKYILKKVNLTQSMPKITQVLQHN